MAWMSDCDASYIATWTPCSLSSSLYFVGSMSVLFFGWVLSMFHVAAHIRSSIVLIIDFALSMHFNTFSIPDCCICWSSSGGKSCRLTLSVYSLGTVAFHGCSPLLFFLLFLTIFIAFFIGLAIGRVNVRAFCCCCWLWLSNWLSCDSESMSFSLRLLFSSDKSFNCSFIASSSLCVSSSFLFLVSMLFIIFSFSCSCALSCSLSFSFSLSLSFVSSSFLCISCSCFRCNSLICLSSCPILSCMACPILVTMFVMVWVKLCSSSSKSSWRPFGCAWSIQLSSCSICPLISLSASPRAVIYWRVFVFCSKFSLRDWFCLLTMRVSAPSFSTVFRIVSVKAPFSSSVCLYLFINSVILSMHCAISCAVTVSFSCSISMLLSSTVVCSVVSTFVRIMLKTFRKVVLRVRCWLTMISWFVLAPVSCSCSAVIPPRCWLIMSSLSRRESFVVFSACCIRCCNDLLSASAFMSCLSFSCISWRTISNWVFISWFCAFLSSFSWVSAVLHCCNRCISLSSRTFFSVRLPSSVVAFFSCASLSCIFVSSLSTLLATSFNFTSFSASWVCASRSSFPCFS